MTERDILHENGEYWVCKDKHGLFLVMRDMMTHTEMLNNVGYADKSLAIARCDYLANHAV